MRKITLAFLVLSVGLSLGCSDKSVTYVTGPTNPTIAPVNIPSVPGPTPAPAPAPTPTPGQ